MKKILLYILVSTLVSCIDTDSLSLDKYDSITVAPDILIPFVQVELSDVFYDSIHSHQATTQFEVEMKVDFFEKNEIPKEINSIEFYFATVNGYPIYFNSLNITFLDEGKNTVESINLKDIKEAKLNSDNSLDEATVQFYPEKETPTKIIDISEFENISKTRFIILEMKWKSAAGVPTDKSFYFNANSFAIFKTKIK